MSWGFRCMDCGKEFYNGDQCPNCGSKRIEELGGKDPHWTNI